MDSRLTLFLLLFGIVRGDCAYARSETDMSQTTVEGVATIRLTSFDANEQSFRVGYAIVNGSCHNVWICEGIEIAKAGAIDHEVYIDADRKTLMIRRSLQKPLPVVLPGPVRIEGRYVCVRPAEEHAGSFFVPVPVQSRPVFAPGGPDVPTASRLIVEIGFYDVDIPTKLAGILSLADMLKCTQPRGTEMNLDTFNEYFPGLAIANAFGGVRGFSSFWEEGSDEIKIPWLWPVLKENSLRLTIDPVLIPCVKK